MSEKNDVYQTTLSDGTVLSMTFQGECDKDKMEAAIHAAIEAYEGPHEPAPVRGLWSQIFGG